MTREHGAKARDLYYVCGWQRLVTDECPSALSVVFVNMFCHVQPLLWGIQYPPGCGILFYIFRLLFPWSLVLTWQYYL